jgi:serine/threonine-protein kinase
VVIMELIQGGELHTERLSAEQLRSCFAQLAEALSMIAEQRIVHCDVKPANVLLRRQEVAPVLVDFGVAWDLAADGEQQGIYGTPYFMAPEAFRQTRPTPAWDAYSLGVTAATVLGVQESFTRLLDIAEAKRSGAFDAALLEGLRQRPQTELTAWAAALLDRDGERRLQALAAARQWRAAP